MSWVLPGWACYGVVEVLATVRWQILFSDAVCAFAQLSSPPPNATAQSVEPLHASRVAKALSSTPTDGSHVSAPPWLHASVCAKFFCDALREPSRDRAWLEFSFALCPASAAATSHQLSLPSRGQWQSPAQAIERHVRPLGCVPFPHAQTRLPGSKEISLRVRRHAPFPLLVLQAYQNCFAPSYVFGRNEKCIGSPHLSQSSWARRANDY